MIVTRPPIRNNTEWDKRTVPKYHINDDSYTGTQSVNNPLPTGTDMIRVIVQHDAAAPYICLFKFS